MNNLREELAALEHAQWAGWLKYLFDKSTQNEEGGVEIPPQLVARWKRQMTTAYIDLSEAEKESDRAEADKVLHVIQIDNISGNQS